MIVPVSLVLLSALLALAVLSRSLTPSARTRRRLRRVERSPIGTAPDGPVKVAGRLRLAGKSLRAPLSGRRCALYDVEVTEHAEVDRVLIHERRACDFLLDDGTGTALVRIDPVAPGAQGAQVELAVVQDGKYASGTFHDATPELERFLSIYHEKSTGPLLLNRRLTYREGVFEPGERIVVYGRAQREADPDEHASGATYRERPTRLVIGPLDGKIHLSDEPDVVPGAAKR